MNYSAPKSGCVFCHPTKSTITAEDEFCYAIDDLYPVTEHHTLVIPKRHEPNFFDLHQREITAIHTMLVAVKNKLEELDNSITGFNIGVNIGKDAGQSVFHSHMHLIPRRYEDANKTTNNPLGGIRWAIPKR